MSDFVIRKKEQRTSKVKTLSSVKLTRKEFGFVLKTVLFIAAFSGLIYMLISSNNLMLNEILVSGGILSLVFFIHILSNR
ncbi:hypothetical protein [uncultured Winogradskyella sp.]|uniref:hypothetical protein n=1 Tax=uncultured Winogradskyella sp. TaxID=395353 RepID=UPI002621DC05|nr:hypothetical protein [uncultured Winogradskyella sp.]